MQQSVWMSYEQCQSAEAAPHWRLEQSAAERYTRPTTSGESNWEHACMKMDNILNTYCERVWLAKVMDK